MSTQVMALTLVLAAALVASFLILLTGYRWGAFAALQALRNHSPKWKAYCAALIPPAALATTLLLDAHLAPMAHGTFWAFATPAALGTCFRYNRGAVTII